MVLAYAYYSINEENTYYFLLRNQSLYSEQQSSPFLNLSKHNNCFSFRLNFTNNVLFKAIDLVARKGLECNLFKPF